MFNKFYIEVLEYCNIEMFCNEVDEAFWCENIGISIENKDEEECSFSIVAHYNNAIKIIENLIRIGYSPKNIIIKDPGISGYHDEFVISLGLSDDCKRGEIWCQEMRPNTPTSYDDGYIYLSDEFCYVFDDCNQRVLRHIKNSTIYKAHIISTSEKEVIKNQDPFEETLEKSPEKNTSSSEMTKSKKSEPYHTETNPVDMEFTMNAENYEHIKNSYIEEMVNNYRVFLTNIEKFCPLSYFNL